MIRLKRPREPKLFSSPAIRRTRAYVAEHLAELRMGSGQIRLDGARLMPQLHRARPALLAMTHGKCAYCESVLDERNRFNLEMFRPTRALDLRGQVAPLHYVWLATHWGNLLPSCQSCNVSKGNRFPIQGNRCEVGATSGRALAAERPLLLDPCADDPALHLLFDDEGRVSPSSERGATTIEILSLNRASLVRDRQMRLDHVRKVLTTMLGDSDHHRLISFTSSVKSMRRLLSDGMPHLGALRQQIRLLLSDQQYSKDRAKVEKILGRFLPRPRGSSAGPSRKRIENAQARLEARLQQKERHSVEAGSTQAKEAYFGGLRRIERVAIHNFKAIESLELTVPQPVAEGESWLMMVGENGTGKSSILQAIALALLGQQHTDRMGLAASGFVRYGSDEGSVEVELTNVSRPVELRFSRGDRKFKVTPPKELVLLLGYGATRLLTRTATAKSPSSRYVRVKNLFNPYARLQNAEAWLTSRRYVKDKQFKQIAEALKRLLLVPDSTRIVRKRSRIRVEQEGRSDWLRDMSDGFQSVVALAVDIMMGVAKRWSNISDAEGIVLIDEIETHLHPAWKMEIVPRLRSVFPKVMFIVTTHDPLCLRGLLPGEILVLRKNDGKVTVTPVTEPIDNLRADQLLTSELFGLQSTRDPALHKSMERHAVLAGKTARTASEGQEMQTLAKSFSGKLLTRETALDNAVEQKLQILVEQQVMPLLKERMGGWDKLEGEAGRALQEMLTPQVATKKVAGA